MENKHTKILEKKQEDIRKKLNYMLWLEKFTENNPKFSNFDFLDGRKNLSEEDKKNIYCFNLFYNVIKKYCENNYIYPVIDSKNSSHFNIKYNNIGYQIGLSCGEYSYMYCKRNDNYDDTYINYEDILLNKKQPHTDDIKKILEELQTIVISYYEQGIPIQAIQSSLNEIEIQLFNKSENDKMLGKIL